jgi:hypothetical protein
MKAIAGVFFAMMLAGLAACAGAYVAGDAGSHHQQLAMATR